LQYFWREFQAVPGFLECHLVVLGEFLGEFAHYPNQSVSIVPASRSQFQVSTQVPSGSVVLADWSKVTACNFGPSQVLVDGFSGGKSIRGDVELIVSNFVDIALAEVDDLVIGSA